MILGWMGQNPKFEIADVFEMGTDYSSSVVLCNDVLEHLVNYKEALAKILELTKIRAIITVPFKNSYPARFPPPKGHCNFWDDTGEGNFKDIREFRSLCYPYFVSITKMRTKPRDVQMKQWAYLIVVDKRQKWCCDDGEQAQKFWR